MKAYNFLGINETGMVSSLMMNEKTSDEKMRLLESVA
jgi:hypothetical protein